MRKDIHREIHLAAPIERVWRALTDPDELAAWYMRVQGFELRVGARFTFHDKPQGKWDGIINCEVLEVDAPNRLALSFTGNQMKSVTTVRYTLVAEANETRLRVDHTGFEGFSDTIIGTIIAFGWKKFLGKLRSHVGR